MPFFQITKRSLIPYNSKTTPQPSSSLAAGTLVNDYGTAFEFSATDGAVQLASGLNRFAGFITRKSQVGGATLEDVTYPGRIQLPFVAGGPASFEYGEELETEFTPGQTNNWVVGSGSNSISGSTATGTNLSFSGGAFCVAATGQNAEFELVSFVTPEVVGNVRFRARKLTGQMVGQLPS